MNRLAPPPYGTGIAFVTGAGGFLGGAALAAFQAAGWRAMGFGHPGPGASGLVEGDISAERLAKAARETGVPEVVLHFAGGASVAASVSDPERDRARTLGSLAQTLTFLRDHAREARLVYPSSAAVYGAGASGPIGEDHSLAPMSPYGRHKQAAEAMIAEAASDFGLKAAIVRFFSLYGPGLRKQLLWELAGRLEAGPGEVALGGSGQEMRDFLYVEDAVRLVGALIPADLGGAPLIVNGGSGSGVSVRQIAEALAGALGSPARITFSGVVRAGDPPSLVADTSRLGALGFAPEVDLDGGLQRLAAWFRAGAGAPGIGLHARGS
jgi:UDP-glucose 4-epimerase